MACVSDNIVGMDELLNRISLEEMHMLDEVILQKLIEPELEVEALPEEMYHYTSPNGLKGILESNSLWFTNYRFLNDKSEKVYTYNLLEECLLKKKDELAEVFFRQIMDGLCQEKTDTNKTRWFNDIYQVPEYYIASFACNGDSLSLWNYYTKNVNKIGYNIRFSLGLFKKSLKSISFSVHRVIYDKKEQEEKLTRLINEFNAGWNEQQSVNYLGVLIALFWEMVDLYSIEFKSPAFQEENEIRIVYKDDKKHSLKEKFREVNGIFVPYFEVSFSKECVNGITISPMQREELVVDGVCRLLKHYGYCSVGKEKVALSEIPLRY